MAEYSGKPISNFYSNYVPIYSIKYEIFNTYYRYSSLVISHGEGDLNLLSWQSTQGSIGVHALDSIS